MTVEMWHCGLELPILAWFREHAIVHTAEPSFKLSQGQLSADRGLFGFNKRRLGQDADQALLAFSARLGMPPELMAHYQAALRQTGYVGFGFECDGETRRYKAYLDFSDQVALAAKELVSANDSRMLFLGFKWNIAGGGRPVLTEYRAYPLLSRRGMRRRGLELLGALGPAKAVVEAAFAVCARDWADRPLEYMEAREAGNARVSFDIKFYSTSMKLSDIRPELHGLANQLGIARPLQDLLEAHADSPLGHLAGGLDRVGEPFLMVYHGVKRRVTPAPAAE
jgi:hypothetical protein